MYPIICWLRLDILQGFIFTYIRKYFKLFNQQINIISPSSLHIFFSTVLFIYISPMKIFIFKKNLKGSKQKSSCLYRRSLYLQIKSLYLHQKFLYISMQHLRTQCFVMVTKTFSIYKDVFYHKSTVDTINTL